MLSKKVLTVAVGLLTGVAPVPAGGSARVSAEFGTGTGSWVDSGFEPDSVCRTEEASIRSI